MELKILNKEEFTELFEKHSKFLKGESGGSQLILENVDLSSFEIGKPIGITSIFDNVVLRNVKLPKLNLTQFRWIFINCKLSDISFENEQLLGTSSFKNNKLTNINFKNANIERCDFSDSVLKNVIYDSKTKTNESFLKAYNSLEKLTQEDFRKLYENHLAYLTDIRTGQKLILENVDLTDVIIHWGDNLKLSVFKNVKFGKIERFFAPNAEFENISFENLELRDSYFVDAKFNNVNFNGAKIENCRFLGADLKNIKHNSSTSFNQKFADQLAEGIKKQEDNKISKTVVSSEYKIISQQEFNHLKEKHVQYRNGITNGEKLILENFDLTNIKPEPNLANLEDVILKNVKLPQLSSLYVWYTNNAKLSEVAFQGDLYTSNFNNSELENIDFTNCNVEKCSFENAKLTNIKFDKNTTNKFLQEYLNREKPADEPEKLTTNSDNGVLVDGRKLLTLVEFREKYNEHQKWLQDKTTGKQLDLSNSDLTNIDLTDFKNFQHSICKNTLCKPTSGTDFSYSDLTNFKFFETFTAEKLNFTNTNLTNVVFSQSCICNSIFNNTILTNVKVITHSLADVCTCFNNNKKEKCRISEIVKEYNELQLQKLKEETQALEKHTLENSSKNQLKKLTQAEFDQKYLEHKKWIVNNIPHYQNQALNNTAGKRLDISNCDLSDIEIALEADFRLAICTNAKIKILKGNCYFAYADLTNTNFEGSNLENVNFFKSICIETSFNDTNLKNASYLTRKENITLQNVKINNNTICSDEFRKLVNETLSINSSVGKLKTITQKDLDEQYQAHLKWLSDGDSGYRLDLSNTDISNLDLTKIIDFRHSICINTKFPIDVTNKLFAHAILTNTNFENSNLTSSNLISTSLNGTNFLNANLSKATLLEFNVCVNVKINDNTICAPAFRQLVNRGKTSKSQITQEEFNNRYRKHIDWLTGGSGGLQLDLSNLDISNIAISNLNFSKSLCEGTVFPKNCKYVDFTLSFLTESNFENSNLEGSSFRNTILENVNFEGANLFGSVIENSYLKNIKYNFRTIINEHFINQFEKQNSEPYRSLTQEEFNVLYEDHLKFINDNRIGSRLNLSHLNLEHIDIVGKDLRHSICHGTKFGKVYNVVFTNSQLVGAKFSTDYKLYADFTNANLTSADFKGVDCKDCTFDNATFDQTQFNCYTKFNSINNQILFKDKCLFVTATTTESKTSEPPQKLEKSAVLTPEETPMTDSQNTINRKTLTQIEIDKIHEEHKLWLENPKKGKRADLSNIDMDNCDHAIFLNNYNFKRAICNNAIMPRDVANCNFDEADLSGTDFEDSNLTGSSFRKSILNFTNLIDSDLDACVFDDAEILNISHSLSVSGDYGHSLIKRLNEIKNASLKAAASIAKVEKPGILETAKQNALSGMQIAAGNQTAHIIHSHVSKALIRLKIPKEILEHFFVKNLLLMAAPQILTLFAPHLPFNIPDKVKETLKLACSSSVAMVTEEAMEEAVSFVIPALMPMLKALEEGTLETKKVKKQISAAKTSTAKTSKTNSKTASKTSSPTKSAKKDVS